MHADLYGVRACLATRDMDLLDAHCRFAANDVDPRDQSGKKRLIRRMRDADVSPSP